MPAARVFYVLALTGVLVMAAVVLPPLAWVAVSIDSALVAAFLLDLVRARRTPLAAVRTWPPLLVQGTASTLAVKITAGAACRAQLRETLHPALAELPCRTSLDLTAHATREWAVALDPRRRGEHESGPLLARVRGPWGLAWSQRSLLPPVRRRVFPQVRWEGRVGSLLVLAHRRSLGRNPRRLTGLGSEPYALREYLSGDPAGKIHWKASARHGRLVTREDTWDLGARLVVLLDCARGMSGMDGARSKLDHALAAALALTRVAASRGDRVSLVAFSDQVERTVRLHGGGRDAHTAYAALYDLEARDCEPAYDLVAEAAIGLESRRSTVVLLTSVVDLAAAELLRTSLMRLERRHAPILINLIDPELTQLAVGAPETRETAFAKVAALEILLANRRLERRLRRAGVRCASTSADQLALATLESYLEMYRRRAA